MLWDSLEVPCQGASNEYHNIFFHGEMNIHTLLIKKKSILSGAMVIITK